MLVVSIVLILMYICIYAFLLPGIACPTLVVENSRDPSPILLRYPESRVVYCDYQSGFATPAGYTSFNAQCQYSGTHAHLVNVEECIGSFHLWYFLFLNF